MVASEKDISLQVALLQEESATWRFFHDLFRMPSPEQWEWLHDDRVQAAWTVLVSRTGAAVLGSIPLPDAYEDYEATYLSAFEVGFPQPLCPLFESHWDRAKPPPRVLLENSAFYERFGLRFRAGSRERADHLRYQLELLAHLCRLEAEALSSGADQTACRITEARTEFLVRHINTWVPKAAEVLSQAAPEAWPTHHMRLLAEWCATLET